MVLETLGLVPIQFKPHRTLGQFQIGANMVVVQWLTECYMYYGLSTCKSFR